jgi:hypothetical protein
VRTSQAAYCYCCLLSLHQRFLFPCTWGHQRWRLQFHHVMTKEITRVHGSKLILWGGGGSKERLSYSWISVKETRKRKEGPESARATAVTITSVYGNDNDMPRGSTCSKGFTTIYISLYVNILLLQCSVCEIHSYFPVVYLRGLPLTETSVKCFDACEWSIGEVMKGISRGGLDIRRKDSVRLVSILPRIEPRTVRIRINLSYQLP